MNELSVFIDESGDFGEYNIQSPFYIVTMVFHNQAKNISNQIKYLDDQLLNIGLAKHTIHTGPIIRKEGKYKYLDVIERRKIFNKMIAFFKIIDIKHKSFNIEKKHIDNIIDASGKLSKQIATFIKDNYSCFSSYDVVKVYYDNGQIELNRILSAVFNAHLNNVEFKRVFPSDYKLFQVADMLCTFELIRLKLENGELSKSELQFFGNIRDLKKNYLRFIKKKEHF